MPGTRLFSRMNYQVLRGMSELITKHELDDIQWQTILTFFNQKCAFCGADNTGNPRTGLIPDHLIPASNLGDMVLGNAVPACQDCNDARGNRDWRSWLQEQYQVESMARIERIEQYLQQYPYTPAIPESRLNPDELSEYNSILQVWDSLWARARALRGRVSNRRNGT